MAGAILLFQTNLNDCFSPPSPHHQGAKGVEISARRKKQKTQKKKKKYTALIRERFGARSVGMEIHLLPLLPLSLPPRSKGERYPRKPEMIPVAIALKFEETIFYPLPIDENRGNEFPVHGDLRGG